MSNYYTPKRSRNIYDPNDFKPFKLSRSKIELFIECPRCFYIDRRLGVGRPPGFPFNLNSAVDTLLKKEFDFYRENSQQHPLLEKYDVDAHPVPHQDLDKWRQNFTGIQYLHEPTNLLISGAIDDLWQNSNEEYIVVDYKATSKNEKNNGVKSRLTRRLQTANGNMPVAIKNERLFSFQYRIFCLL